MRNYITFAELNHNNMGKIVNNYTEFLQENVENDEIKMFYTLETKRIEIPVGSDTTTTKNDNKKELFLKIIKKISNICKFIKIPEPVLTPIGTKKYYGVAHNSETGALIFDDIIGNSKITDDINTALAVKERLSSKVKNEPRFLITKNVEIMDLKMATIIKPDNEWVILGIIDHVDGLLKAAPKQQVPINLVPSNLTSSSYCDHCRKTLRRNKTVFVENTVTKEIKRVGGTCIKFYLGYDYEKILEYLTDISFINEYSDDVNISGWDDYSGYGGGVEIIEVSTTEIIKYFYWFYKNRGYISKSGAEKINLKREEAKISNPDYSYKQVYSTADLVLDDVVKANDPPKPKNFKKGDYYTYKDAMNDWIEFNKEYHKRTQTTTDGEYKLVADFIEANKDNNFIFNANNMIKSGSILLRLAHYITGACSWYFGKLAYEDMKKKAAESKPKDLSEWIGVVGEKIKLENLEIVHISGFNTEYGWSSIYKMIDQNGNHFTKFGTIGTKFIVKKVESNDENIQVGDVISATAEIKKHDLFNGVKQTVLGRLSKL
jgi:hypothetical protein